MTHGLPIKIKFISNISEFLCYEFKLSGRAECEQLSDYPKGRCSTLAFGLLNEVKLVDQSIR